MKRYTTFASLVALAIGAHADLIQLNTGRTLSGRLAGYANDSFELQPTNAAPVKVPANTVASIDFSRGAVLATVELPGQPPREGKVWLYARGAFNFDDDKGDTTRIPLAKVSRVAFSTEPIPEKPTSTPPPRRASPRPNSPVSPTDAKVATITHGDQVDIQKHCVPGKITIVDFYADWCGPCRTIGPIIEQRVNKDDDLVLRKVDIVAWDSPVSQQYGIRAVPCIQVYDRRGNKVGQLVGFNNSVFESYISRAR
jgi:thiol-disulfide isomerase/thioredoxin